MAQGNPAGLRSYSQQISASSATVSQVTSPLNQITDIISSSLHVPGTPHILGAVKQTQTTLNAHAQLREALAKATNAVADAVEHSQQANHTNALAATHLHQMNTQVSNVSAKVAEATVADSIAHMPGSHGPTPAQKQHLSDLEGELKRAKNLQWEAQQHFNATNTAAQEADHAKRMTECTKALAQSGSLGSRICQP